MGFENLEMCGPIQGPASVSCKTGGYDALGDLKLVVSLGWQSRPRRRVWVRSSLYLPSLMFLVLRVTLRWHLNDKELQ